MTNGNLRWLSHHVRKPFLTQSQGQKKGQQQTMRNNNLINNYSVVKYLWKSLENWSLLSSFWLSVSLAHVSQTLPPPPLTFVSSSSEVKYIFCDLYSLRWQTPTPFPIQFPSDDDWVAAVASLLFVPSLVTPNSWTACVISLWFHTLHPFCLGCCSFLIICLLILGRQNNGFILLVRAMLLCHLLHFLSGCNTTICSRPFSLFSEPPRSCRFCQQSRLSNFLLERSSQCCWNVILLQIRKICCCDWWSLACSTAFAGTSIGPMVRFLTEVALSEATRHHDFYSLSTPGLPQKQSVVCPWWGDKGCPTVLLFFSWKTSTPSSPVRAPTTCKLEAASGR